MQSALYDWESILPVPTKTGTKRPFFRTPTDTLEKLAVHVSTLNAGEAAHAPHQHAEEEMIICKEGALEAFHNGQTKTMGPGSVLFLASNDLHGVRATGDSPATYYVIKWFCHPNSTPPSTTTGGVP